MYHNGYPPTPTEISAHWGVTVLYSNGRGGVLKPTALLLRRGL
jgi:hypothetical protein